MTDVGLVCVVERYDLTELKEYYYYYYYCRSAATVCEVYGCRDDYVEIYALYNGTVRPRQIGRYCGTNRSPMFARLGGLRVRFVSNEQFTNRGFVADFFISRRSTHTPSLSVRVCMFAVA